MFIASRIHYITHDTIDDGTFSSAYNNCAPPEALPLSDTTSRSTNIGIHTLKLELHADKSSVWPALRWKVRVSLSTQYQHD